VSHTGPDILSPQFENDPNVLMAVMRDDFPVFWHEGMQTWVLSRYDDVERAFKDKVFTSDNYSWQLEPVHGRTILQMEGREHSVHRNLIQPAFRGSELTERFVPAIETSARELIDPWRSSGRVDLVNDFTIRFPIDVIVSMLGLDKVDHNRFRGWYHSIMAFLGNLSGDQQVTAQGLATKAELEAYMLPIIADRRANPAADLLSTLCVASIDGEQMSDEEIKAFVSLLLVAGGETTDKALSNMFMNLIAHPDQLQAVSEDRTLIDDAFAETLRHSPPVQMIMRQPSEDVEIQGVVVPAGSTVTCLIAAANRDPRKFADPDRFDIFRGDLDTGKAFSGAANHVGFCLGRHFCVGAMLAKTEVEIAANQLLDAMTDISFEGPPPVPTGVFTRAPGSMPLTFTPTAR
jgi:pulcherriminic acid synthase